MTTTAPLKPVLAVVGAVVGFVVGTRLVNPKRRKARPNKLTKLLTEMPKTCRKCGTVYTEAKWQKLLLLGYTVFEGESTEYRDCPCGTTLSRTWECTED